MINWLFNRFGKLPAVYLDGWLYVLIAFFGAWAACLSSDEAAKWIADWLLFWLRSSCSCISASLLALKMYRSTSFAEHQAEKKMKEGGTSFLTKDLGGLPPK